MPNTTPTAVNRTLPRRLPNTAYRQRNRSEAFEKLVKAAGGKLVAMYATMTDGPGALAIFDADPAVAPSVGAVVASSDGVHNFKMVRLFTMDEVIGIRKKRIELQKSYSPPTQAACTNRTRR